MTEPEDPTVAAMRTADEALRAACHASYVAPATPGELYARTGELYAILTKVEQVANALRRNALALTTSPPPGLYSDDATHPVPHAHNAAANLLVASGRVRRAHASVNEAWSSLSHLGVDPERHR